MNANFQRVGSISNAHVGRGFEVEALKWFRQQDIQLRKDYSVPVGVPGKKKDHKFDLGSGCPPVLVECKSHKWTAGGNVPSAKMTVWNEAMLYFSLAPDGYRKILFVLKDYSDSKGQTLAQYYIKTYWHLIPKDVDIIEYDESTETAKSLAWT